MSDSYNTRIKLKRDTEANWTSKNPVLLDGEMVIVKTNDGKIRKKIGDGVKKFSELPYDEIAIDSATSTTSTNPVQNKVITLALDGKAGTAVATTSANGLLSSADKKKLDGIATGATKITVDTALSSTSINPVQNKAIKTELDKKAGTSVATTGANGLMSADDKTKLNSIATGANKTIVDSSLSASSANPVQNKTVKSALDGKLSTSGGTLTGNLTGKYIAGTWLQTTDATDLSREPGKIAVLDESGWVYYRTPTEIKSDIGVVDSADYVVEQSSNNFWRWRKWNSGIAELWAVSQGTRIAISEPWGSMYFGTWMNLEQNISARKYPFAFVQSPSVSATYSCGNKDAWLSSVFRASEDPRVYAPAYALVRPDSTTIDGPSISYYVIGKYK